MQKETHECTRPQILLQNRLGVVLGCLILVATAAIFVPVLHHGFVAWDDALHVQANPRMQPVTWAHVRAFWDSSYEHLYIPLTYTLWAALAWVSKTFHPGPLSATWFHGFNLLLHLASVWIVFIIARAVYERKQTAMDGHDVGAAAAGALLFGVHPLQVEAVAWVSGLKDVLCGWWSLVALWQYLAYLQARQGTKQKRHYSIASMAYGLALLSKPAAMVVPVMAWVIAIAAQGRSWRQVTRTLWIWLVVAALWGIWTKGLQPDSVLIFRPPIWARLLVAADALTFYTGKLFWPLGLGPDYGRTPQLVLGLGWSVITTLVAAVVGVVLWRRRRQCSGIVLAAGVLVSGLLPVLGLVPFMFQAYSTVADRYVYLAMLGPALGLTWLVQCLPRVRTAWPIIILVLGLLSWRSADQVRVWRDTVTLFTHALELNPRSALAHNNLGLTLAQQGKLDAAVSHYSAALQFRPEVPTVHYNLGNALLRQGQIPQAVTHYAWAVKLKPTWAEAHNNLGSALDEQGQVAEAVAHYELALRLKPDFAEAHNNLGDALLKQENTEEAIKRFRIATRLKPDWAEAHYNLGVALIHGKRLQEALNAYREAHRLRPEWVQVKLPLALLLLTPRSVPASVATEAVQLAEAVCASTQYRDAFAVYTLARAYQAAARPGVAWRTARRALDLATTAGHTTLVQQITSAFPTITSKEPVHVMP